MSHAVKSPGDKQSETSDGDNVFGTWKHRRQSAVSSSADEEAKPPPPGSLLKRRSTFKGVATSLLSLRRLTKGRVSEVGLDQGKPKIRMENTYKLDPDEDSLFRSKRVEDTVQKLLEKELCNEKYNESRCKSLACDLSVLIKSKVKEIGFPRYKIICNVVIGQCCDQGVEMASQCIWSPDTDNFSCSSYRNTSLFAVAIVHAVYYE